MKPAVQSPATPHNPRPQQPPARGLTLSSALAPIGETARYAASYVAGHRRRLPEGGQCSEQARSAAAAVGIMLREREPGSSRTRAACQTTPSCVSRGTFRARLLLSSSAGLDQEQVAFPTHLAGETSHSPATNPNWSIPRVTTIRVNLRSGSPPAVCSVVRREPFDDSLFR